MNTQANESGESPQAGEKRRKGGCASFSWPLLIIIVVIVVAVLLELCRPSVSPDRGKAREDEVQANLHSIQLAVERYAVDHKGQYPPYLIGGEGQYSLFIEGSSNAFMLTRPCPDHATLSDPLLREGYLDAYPRNPFVSNGASVHHFQEDVGDALSNASDAGREQGTRFGGSCATMGNVMADSRYTEFVVYDYTGAQFIAYDNKGAGRTCLTYAGVKYPCSDIWATDTPTAFLPGEFFYRSRSVKVIVDGSSRDEIKDYMLGGYGAIRTKGKDVIGPDPTGVNDVTPFGAAPNIYGNPNGIRDSIILVLTPGWDEPPKAENTGK